MGYYLTEMDLMLREGYAFTGRGAIYTSCLPPQMYFDSFIGNELTAATLVDELNRCIPLHENKALEYYELEMFWKGIQPILRRPKGDRAVNEKVLINYAQAFTRNIKGYTYGAGIQYVANETEFQKDVERISSMCRGEYSEMVINTMGESQSYGGTAYQGVFFDSLEKNDIPFEVQNLSPCNTEVVYSVYNKNTPVFAWTRYATRKNQKNRYIYTVYTAYKKYIFDCSASNKIELEDLRWETEHPLGDVPIIEYPNNHFRIGDWEAHIGLMNAINSMASDSVNDVAQTVMSYLALFGVDIDEDEHGRPKGLRQMKENKLLVFPPATGIQQDAKFITQQIDGQSAQQLRTYLESALKFVAGIPDRDTGSAGSDTGLGAEIRTGSNDLEIVALGKEAYTKAAERRKLGIICRILSGQHISNKLKSYMIDIKIPRTKSDNIQSKTQAGQILAGMGVHKYDIASIMDITSDISGFVSRWEEAIAKAKAEQSALAQTVESVSEEVITVE